LLHIIGTSDNELEKMAKTKGISKLIVYNMLVLEKFKNTNDSKYNIIIRNLEKWLKTQ
jgi:hypothetical protein